MKFDIVALKQYNCNQKHALSRSRALDFFTKYQYNDYPKGTKVSNSISTSTLPTENFSSKTFPIFYQSIFVPFLNRSRVFWRTQPTLVILDSYFPSWLSNKLAFIFLNLLIILTAYSIFIYNKKLISSDIIISIINFFYIL